MYGYGYEYGYGQKKPRGEKGENTDSIFASTVDLVWVRVRCEMWDILARKASVWRYFTTQHTKLHTRTYI